MRTILAILSLLIANTVCADAQRVIKLWESNPPVKNNITEPENNVDHWITNVSEAELTIYLPSKELNTQKAVVVCPGGGYAGLASMHEGTLVAQWLNKQGIAAFVLKYRMPNKHKTVPLDDAWQAIRYVREHATEFNIRPDKIGIAGFSAGGHLASTASTHFAPTGTSTRPDFSILFYPVISMNETTHAGSKSNLLGDNPSLSDLYLFSNEKQVNNATPPTILLLSDDDKVVLPQNSIAYYEALKKNDIKATMYIFPEGGHGWGFRENFKYYNEMTRLLASWLKDI